MAATSRQSSLPAPWPPSTWAGLLALLTLLAFLVQGYHPYAEDGGMYLARVLALLHPSMFIPDAAFVREPLRISLFAPLLAALCRSTHLPLAWIVFFLDLASLAALLFAGRELLRRCLASDAAQLTGVALLATWATLPVAATSLLLTDPSVTARTFSTPLTLLAIAYALDDWRASATTARKSQIACAACLLAAFAFHPLMAAYALLLVALLQLLRTPHGLAAAATLIVAAIACAALAQLLAPADPPAAVAADLSRYYWFLSQWHAYELLGLLAPPLLIAALTRSRRLGFSSNARDLARAVIAFALLGTLIALLFAQQHFRSHFVARFQPLRVFCLIYALLPLLLGAALQQFCAAIASHRPSISASLLRSTPAAIVLASACALFAAQRSTFPASGHFELPWQTAPSPNPWVRAFLWIRSNTPPTAVFALEARYVNLHGEDAQIFRVIAQRSALPDFSKDGGEASQMPQLAPGWQQAAAAQQQLSAQTDAVRESRLLPLGATWMVLLAGARTAQPCPYSNEAVMVCRLAPRPLAP
jgi:hypothetical protein